MAGTSLKNINRPGIAYEGSNCTPPPSGPVPWIAKRNDGKKKTTIISQTWFEARRLAMTELGTRDYSEITVEIKKDEEPLSPSPAMNRRKKKKR